MLETSAAGPHASDGTRSPAASRYGLVRARVLGSVRAARGQWRRIANIGLLVAGLGLGQGTIFIVQTVLVAGGEYELLAAFGTHYSFAILGIILVDAGASTTLARAVARLPAGREARGEVWRIFCETSAIRITIALIIGVAATVYVRQLSSEEFSRWYVALALPGLLLWAVNGVGLLDGLRLSGISGITGSAAYVVTAAGLALAAHKSAAAAGAILGGAFSIGYLVTLIAQWATLARKGWYPQLHKMTRAGLTKALTDGCALSFQIVPGQVTMRVQLVLSTLYLGAETTALFVYAKQIVTASTQIVGFVLRVEFPSLVEKLSSGGKQNLGSMIGAQRMALYCAAMFAVGAIIVAGIAAEMPEFGLHRAAMVIAGFAPTIFTMSLLLLMMQALAATGAYGLAAWALAIGSAAGMLASYVLISILGVYAFAAGEVVLNLVGLYVGYRHLRR